MDGDSLGEAYVTVNADTTAFKAQLNSAVVKATAAAEKANKKSADKMAADATKAAQKASDAEQAARQKAQKAIAGLYAQDIKNAEAAASAASKAAGDAAKAQMAYNGQVLADMRATAAEIASAEKAAYAEVAAAAKAAAKAQIAAQNEVSASALRSAGKVNDPFASIGKLGKGALTGTIDAITSSAKYATIGVGALGIALAGIGIENAAKQQAALVGFTALADQIDATTDSTTGLNVATKGLSQAQQKAIGNDFLQQLIQLSNNSALSQSALQDTSQQLLALGFNGKQSIGIVRDVGNALAASGKSGGQLNEDLKGVITAFAQIKGSGRLLAQDLNQITTRIPAATRIKVYSQLATDLKLASANAKEGTPQFAAMTKNVQKLAKEGLIPADTAIASITKVLENVPGAAKDATTGLDALGRQNETLSGRFEALKDNVRTSLAQAFLIPGEGGNGKSLADQLSDQLGELIPKITATIQKIGPQLATFVTKFAEFGINVLPGLVTLVGNFFEIVTNGLGAISDGFGKFKDAITPTFNILVDLSKIFISGILPFAEGVLTAFGAIGTALGPVAALLAPIADFLQKIFGSEAFVQISKWVGIFAGFFAAFAGGQAVIAGVAAAAGLLATGIEAITVAMLANPIGLIIALVGALAVAFYEAWKKSETFRDVVVAVLNGLKDVIITFVQVNANIILDFFDLIISGAAHAFGWVPGLGGKLKAANVAFDNFKDGVNNTLNGIKDRDIKINGDASGFIQAVRDATKAYNAAGFQGPALPTNLGTGTGVHTSTSLTGSTADDLINNALKHPTDNPDTTGADTAKTKAKAAADKIKAAFADLAGDLKTIGDKTSEQSAAQIKTNFNALIKDLKDSGHSALVAGAKSVEDKLLADVKKLKPVQDKLQAELSIAQGIKDKIVDLGSVTQSNQGIGTTFLGLQNQLRAAIANTQRFTQDIKQLQALHLNRTTIQQLIEAGPVAGLPAAEALLQAGQAGITGSGGINELQGTLTGLGNDLANDTAGELYKAGQAAGDGLLEGLKDKESAIEGEINKIADNMIATMQKKLKSHSPSKVFEGFGIGAGDGLALGLNGSVGKVSAASANMAGATINFGAGSIAVNGSVPRPEATGIMLGQSIVGVLQRQKAQAAINGTG